MTTLKVGRRLERHRITGILYKFIISLLGSFFLGTYIVSSPELFTLHAIRRYFCGKSYHNGIMHRATRKTLTLTENPNVQRQRLYIGVMSTRVNLDTRITALLDTWGKHRDVRLEIFANPYNTTIKTGAVTLLKNGARIITLPGVPDLSYPPQKKSFAMLKYIHDNHLNRFDWFLRADDDAYVKIEETLRLLNKIDADQSHLIGQSGYGKHEEDYLFGANYCMGGTGVFLSRELLRQLGPHLSTCLQQLYTEHEDIELGRCIRTATNVSCSKAWEVSTLFFQNYRSNEGQRDNIEGVSERKRAEALTFHSNKDPNYQYHFHISILSDQIKQLLLKISKMEADTTAMLQRECMKKSNVTEITRTWSTITDQHIFSPTGESIRRLESRLKEALSDTALYGVSQELRRRDHILSSQINDVILKNSRHLVTPLCSEDWIGDVEVRMNKGGEKYLRNVHLRRSFPRSMLFVNEPYDVTHLIERVVKANSRVLNEIAAKERMNFIIRLDGINEHFHRFVKYFEDIGLAEREDISLIFVNDRNTQPSEPIEIDQKTSGVHTIQASIDNDSSQPFIIQLILDKFSPYSKQMKYFDDISSYSKSIESNSPNEDEILFFCDVNLIVSAELIFRIRQHTVKRKQVYCPTFLSHYNSRDLHLNSASVGNKARLKFGGEIAIYKSDYLEIGFESSKEDLGAELCDDVAKNTKLQVFKANEPSLIYSFYGNSTKLI